MNKKMQHILLTVLLLLASMGRAQNYPVQTFVTIAPPYSSYFPDYSDPANNQMQIILTLTDFNAPPEDVRLRFTISGPNNNFILTSVDPTFFPLITLQPGIPTVITGSYLAPYLNPDNLNFQGLNKDEYLQTQLIPEGLTSICVEVLDASSNNTVLSNPACAQNWFSKKDPPILTMPFCGDEITPFDPQSMVFNWTPTGFSINPTEYVFELYHMIPDYNGLPDPNLWVTQSAPIWTDSSFSPIYNYNITHPTLLVGQTYCWRVKAKDPSGRDYYFNQGWSQPCTFTYGNIASSILDDITLELESNGTGRRQGKAWWNASSSLESYVLELRKTGDANYDWFPYTTAEGELKVNSLEPSTEYECRVKGVMGTAETDWSNTSTFSTLPNEDYPCGSDALPPSQNNAAPLPFLQHGMYVQVGQFEMFVTAAEPDGGPGLFKGYGRITVPFMLTTMNVEFEKLQIDENMMVVGGRVDAISEDVDAWVASFNNTYINGTISNIQPNTQDSTIVIYLEDGSSQTFEWPTDGPITFTDDSGLIYTVNPDGTVTVAGQITWDDDNTVEATTGHQIYFEKSDNQFYGFDDLQHMQWTKNYPCIALSDGGKYFVPWKSIGVDDNDAIVAVIVDSTGAPINNPIFKDEDDNLYNATSLGNGKWEVTIPSFALPINKRVYAYDDQGKRVGKFNLLRYARDAIDLIVVPVNGASVQDATTLQTDINNAFAQANYLFNVEIKPDWGFNYDGVEGNNGNVGLQVSDPEFMDALSVEMKAIRDAYFEQFPDAEKQANYLFVVPEFENEEQHGYNVVGKSIGFIKGGSEGRVYAHELGHSFGLRHTFPEVEQGTTSNLLDYNESASAVHLTAEQWKKIRDFSFNFSFMDNVEDGGLYLSNVLNFYQKNKNLWVEIPDDVALILLDGTTLIIDDIDSAVFDLNGKVYKFSSNGVIYRPKWASSTENYYYGGYLNENDFTELSTYEVKSQAWKDKIIDLRFKGFQNCTEQTTVYFKSVKEEFGQYTDCYCDHFYKRFENINAYEYANKQSWYYPKAVQYRYISGGPFTYENCIGDCIDYNSYNVDGPAEMIFFELTKIFTSDKWDQIAELTRYINGKVGQNSFAFYTSFDEKWYNGLEYIKSTHQKYIDKSDYIITYLIEKEIYSKDLFLEEFPYLNHIGTEYYNVFSSSDLWAFKDQNPNYNILSIDFTSFPIPHVKDWIPEVPEPLLEIMDYIENLYNHQSGENPDVLNDPEYLKIKSFIDDVRAEPEKWLEIKLLLRTNIISAFWLLGMFDPYEYDLNDLVQRDQIFTKTEFPGFKSAILGFESEGKAQAIHITNGYHQYVSQYDTDCAFFLGFQYFKMYGETLFEPAVAAMLSAKMMKLRTSFKKFSPTKKADDIFRAGASSGKYSTKFDDYVEVLEKESLYGDDAQTFLDAEYRTVKSIRSVTAYRSFGGNAKIGGTFVTTKSGASRSELAILDEWNNTMRFEAKINIPKGVKMNIGKAAPKTSKDGLQTLTGGGDQAILPYQWDTQWVNEIKDLSTGKVYKSVEEFSVDFPELVSQ